MRPPDGIHVGCGGDCPRCASPGDAGAPDEVRGARLVAWACGVFLLPLVAAAVGARLAGPGATGQVLGAAAGTAIGIGAARGWMRMTKTGRRDGPA